MRYRCLFWKGGGFLPFKKAWRVGAPNPLEAAKKAYGRVVDATGVRASDVWVTAPDETVTHYRIDRDARTTPEGGWALGPHFDPVPDDEEEGVPKTPTHDELRAGVAEIFANLASPPDDSE